MARYKIVRFFASGKRRRILATGLTLEQAQAHCNDPETSSKTASWKAYVYTLKHGPWFDGYEVQR